MTGDNDETDAGDSDAPDADPGTPDPDEPADADGSTGPADGSDTAAGDGERDDVGATDADTDGDRSDAGADDTGSGSDTDSSDGSADAGGSEDGDGSGDASEPDDTGGSDDPDGDGSGGSGSPSPGGPGGSGPGGPGGEGPDDPYRRDVDPERVEYLASELADLQAEVDGLEGQVEDKTVHRDDVEAELRRYVRARQRKGHATGWGPYLVLLYGVVMTLGAFYYLGGVWAILAMIIVWLSTLGLYVFMAVFSTGITVTRRVAALRNTVSRFRN